MKDFQAIELIEPQLPADAIILVTRERTTYRSGNVGLCRSAAMWCVQISERHVTPTGQRSVRRVGCGYSHTDPREAAEVALREYHRTIARRQRAAAQAPQQPAADLTALMSLLQPLPMGVNP